VINQKYQKYSDLSTLHRSASQVLNIITRDLRMAGYQDLDTVNGLITLPPIITRNNDSARGGDAIVIVYDTDAQNRIVVEYYLLPCTDTDECTEEGRYRLYKTKWSMVNGSSQMISGYYQQAVVDYIDDLQFQYNMANGESRDSVDDDDIKNVRSIDVSILMRTARKHEKDERDYRHELEDNSVDLDGGYIRENFYTTAFTRNLELGD
jgi:Tfp pilus assembly protein PilW